MDSHNRILRIRTVLERTGLSRSTLYRKIEQGTFPRQFKIADRCVGWREAAVEAWLRGHWADPTHAKPVDCLGLAELD